MANKTVPQQSASTDDADMTMASNAAATAPPHTAPPHTADTQPWSPDVLDSQVESLRNIVSSSSAFGSGGGDGGGDREDADANVNVASLLHQLNAAENLALGVESQLDRLLENLDKTLGELERRAGSRVEGTTDGDGGKSDNGEERLPESSLSRPATTQGTKVEEDSG